MRWTVHLDGGPKRVNHAGVSINDRIFSFGGYCSGEDYERTRPMDVHMLNTVTLRWTLLPLPTEQKELKHTPYQRYGHTAVEYENNAYIWGGRNDKKGPCNKLYRFHGATRKWSMPEVTGRKPEARDGHTACVINHCMYVFAGYEEFSNRFSNDMNYVDLRNFQWVSIATQGQPARWRDFHTATSLDNIMYIFGGRCDEGGDQFTNNELYCNRLMGFDTSSRTWIQPEISSDGMPCGRRSHSAFAYNGCIYVFGGYNGRLGIHFNDLCVLNLVTMKWSEIRLPGHCPLPCRRQCCCVVDSKAYFFGGTSPRSQNTSTYTSDSDDFEESNLIDRSDLYVLDFDPTLKTLACMVIIENELDCSYLPHDLRWELSVMTSKNAISPSTTSCKLKGIKAL